jgi:T5orf172 domain
MTTGYLYAMTNKSFDGLIKIGRTTKDPIDRAKQLSRPTGVPESFDVSIYCKVYDCIDAEKKIHKILNTYRNTQKREFFHIPAEVAQKYVIEICQEVNQIHGYISESPIIIKVNRSLDKLDSYLNDDPIIDSSIVAIPLCKIKMQHPGRSTSTDDQKKRIKIIATILKDVYPDTTEKWLVDFSRDSTQEGEIVAWENIVKAFLKINSGKYLVLDEHQKKEAFSLLLERSTMSTDTVIQQHKLQTISLQLAKRILSAYEASPKPISGYIVPDSRAK